MACPWHPREVMKQIRVYDSFLIAQFAAEYLRAHGLAAMALQPRVANEVLAFTKRAFSSPIYIAPGIDEVEAARLLDEGIYVIGFSYPVVPKGTARIRVQVSAAHEQEHLERAVEAFTKVGKRLSVLS